MSRKTRINLYISEEVKNIALKKAEICKNSISKIFEQLLMNNNIINYTTIDIGSIIKVNVLLNEIEQHLYQIKKTIFETIENNNNIDDCIIQIKKFIDNWHAKIHEQINSLSDIICEINKFKQGIIQ